MNATKGPCQLHIAFVSSKKMYYPPDTDDNKITYISRELLKRGMKVTWLEMGKTSEKWERDGIDYVKLGARCPRLVCELMQLARMVSVCRARKVDCVYSDEWLFLRENPARRLVFPVGVRTLGIRYIVDLRDPFIDYEVAKGVLNEGSWRHRLLSLYHRLNYEFTDLAVFPSEAYAKAFRSTGLPERKRMGEIRGVDKDLFNPRVDGRAKRNELGLQDKFVVGWFGMMQSYRQIEEVVIPLIENMATSIPNIHFLIGGQGDLSHRFEGLSKDRAELAMTHLGFVPYDQLPEYLSACDVLLCTLDTRRGFAKLASPLKVLESLAVGRPIIATRTDVQGMDYKDLKGVIWTGTGYRDFADSLIMVHRDYAHYRDLAMQQALDFDRYTLESTISRIADAIEKVCIEKVCG